MPGILGVHQVLRHHGHFLHPVRRHQEVVLIQRWFEILTTLWANAGPNHEQAVVCWTQNPTVLVAVVSRQALGTVFGYYWTWHQRCGSAYWTQNQRDERRLRATWYLQVVLLAHFRPGDVLGVHFLAHLDTIRNVQLGDV